MPGTELRNLVLLTIDAWRADFADGFAGVRLLPALDAVGGHTVRFGNYCANAPWTTPALISMLTGESPARHGVIHQWSNPRPDGPALAKRLGAAGYALPNVCYLNSIDGYHNLGFDPCPLADGAHGAGDAATVVAALREHGQRSQPFFLWYHCKLLHFPYWPAAAYRRRLGIDDGAIPQRLQDSICKEWNVPRDKFRFPASDRELVQRLYAAEVLELNDFLAPILETLLRDGLLERTTLVLAADHGDEHLEHGHVGHASTAEHATLYEEVLRTPLIVVDARIGGPRAIAARIQGVDLYATLLSLVGVPTPAGPGAFDFSAAILDAGGPLPAPNRIFYFHSARMGFRTPRELAAQFVEGIGDGRTKFVAERYDATRFLQFDLARDPGELAPTLSDADADDPALAAALARLAGAKAELRAQ